MRLPRIYFMLLTLAVLGSHSLRAADYVRWQADHVAAELNDVPLKQVLEKIAKASGWQIFYEAGPEPRINATFKDRRPTEALPMLLGKSNYALVPGKDGKNKLFVFYTSKESAVNKVNVSASPKRIHGDLVLSVKKGKDLDIDALANSMGAKVTGRIPGAGVYRLTFDDPDSVDGKKQLLQTNNDLTQVDFNYEVERPETHQAASSASALPFSLKPSPQTEGSLIVGLIDTAVQWEHLPNREFFLDPISVAGPSTSMSSEPTHGTSMAETILNSLNAASAGNQSAARILPVDVYGSSPSTSTFDIAYGISEAVKRGANIINLSLGSSGDSSFLQTLIANSRDQGVIFFAAAGNEPTVNPVYPAAYSQVVAVTAVDRTGQLAPYANRGEFVDIVSPGTSLVPFNSKTWVVTGTSAASAWAAGAAAGISESSKRTPSEVEKAIRTKLIFKSAK